nr:hypothetical protein [Tanacetum cinerariifolium]
MIAILEKYEHNQDFHQIVDFVEASHIRYALTFNPTFYVSHIRQFWSTARIETTEEVTKILATVDGKLRTVSESSIRRNLKLNNEAGIRLGTPTESHHIPTSEASQSSQHELSSLSLPPVATATIPPVILTLPLPTVIPTDTTPLRHYTRRAKIAQSSALPPVADEPASPIGDDSQGEACPTDSGLAADQDRANIAKTSTLPSDSTPRVTSLAADEGTRELEINSLKARIKLLEDKDRGVAEHSGDDASIKGRSLDEKEEAAERVSDDIEEMATVLTSMDAASILTSRGVQVVLTAAEVATATVSIPSGSGVVSTASPIIPTVAPLFTTATESTPYTRRKGKEKMVKSDTPKKKKLQEQIDVQVILIDGLDRNNETVAKYLQEYYQFATEFPIERRIELISDLVKYQNHYAKPLKYQTQQRKPLSRKQQKEFYMSMLKSHAGWKEEAERFKKKGLRLEQESVKKLKTSEEVKATEEVPEEKVKEMMQLVPIEEVYVEALQVKHPIIDWKNLMHAPIEWKLYDTCGVHHVTSKDKEIFMLVEKNYPLRKGLAIVMISYKFDEFPLSEQLPTANEDKFPMLIQSDATAVKLALLLKSRNNYPIQRNINLDHLSGSNKVMFPINNNKRKIMRFNEMYKFSDGTLTHILEALDYRVKEYMVNRVNSGMNMWFWTDKDVTRSKEFIRAIERRLKTKRIFRNLE